jgi:GAF domain-containing protein
MQHPVCRPLIARGQLKGAFEIFHQKRHELDSEREAFPGSIVARAAVAIDNAPLFRNAQRLNMDLSQAFGHAGGLGQAQCSWGN